MNINPSYSELLGREQHRARLEEAEKQRLIRVASLANPSGMRKIWLILRDRWGSFWNQKRDRKGFRSVSPVPGKSYSS